MKFSTQRTLLVIGVGFLGTTVLAGCGGNVEDASAPAPVSNGQPAKAKSQGNGVSFAPPEPAAPIPTRAGGIQATVHGTANPAFG